MKVEEDYRECDADGFLYLLTRVITGYIFRFNASGPPQDGLYAQYDIGNE